MSDADPSPSPSRSLARDLLAFVLSAQCAGCGEPGAVLCARCERSLWAQPIRVHTPDGLAVQAALVYDEVVGGCLRTLKDRNQTMVARPLGAALAAVLAPELERAPEALVVPVPTSARAFRRRGFRVPELLAARAGVSTHRLLRVRGRPADQRGLDAVHRAENMRDRISALRRGEGQPVILLDDVVTTGATFDEAARAIRYAGFRVLTGIALVATPRHRERTANAGETRRK